MSRLFQPATETPVNMHDMMITALCDATNGTQAVATPESIMETAWGAYMTIDGLGVTMNSIYNTPRITYHVDHQEPAIDRIKEVRLHIRARVFRRPR